MIRVLVPSFSVDLLTALLESLDASAPGSLGRVVVGDNGLAARPPGPTYIKVPGRDTTFCYAKAINMMVAACEPHDDLLILEDDMVVMVHQRPWTMSLLGDLLTWPAGYGVLQLCQAPKLPPDQVEESATTVGLGISLIPRRVWDTVGPMDERYEGYGWEDTDWCVRALHMGYRFGTTGSLVVEHRGGQQGYIRRAGDYDALMVRCHQNRIRFQEKWCLPDDPEIKFQPAAPHFNRSLCACTP